MSFRTKTNVIRIAKQRGAVMLYYLRWRCEISHRNIGRVLTQQTCNQQTLNKSVAHPFQIMNHFQRLNKVKELKIFFFAQRAKVPADQNRSGAQHLDQATSALRGARLTNKYITSLPQPCFPIVGPFSNRIKLSAAWLAPLPPPPPSPIRGSLFNNFVLHSPVVLSSSSIRIRVRVTHSVTSLTLLLD